MRGINMILISAISMCVLLRCQKNFLHTYAVQREWHENSRVVEKHPDLLLLIYGRTYSR